MRILVVSHGHPSFSVGGAEVAYYNLHLGFQANRVVDTHYLARVGAPTPRHAGTALWPRLLARLEPSPNEGR